MAIAVIYVSGQGSVAIPTMNEWGIITMSLIGQDQVSAKIPQHAPGDAEAQAGAGLLGGPENPFRIIVESFSNPFAVFVGLQY